MHQKIAKIESTMLGVEDHGILTCMLYVSYGNTGQGIGGYTLDEPVWMSGNRIVTRDFEGSEFKGRVGTAYGMEFVRRILEACGVDKWEALEGRTIYVLKESETWGARVIGIEPLPTEKGKRFLFEEAEIMIDDKDD